MAAIQRFEDIRAWQEARILTKRFYTLCQTLPPLRRGRDRRMCEQWKAASVSIVSNIAEGFARRTPKKFTQTLLITVLTVLAQ
jgi:four helix bundle protein